jgi:hypothetical protein
MDSFGNDINQCVAHFMDALEVIESNTFLKNLRNMSNNVFNISLKGISNSPEEIRNVTI